MDRTRFSCHSTGDRFFFSFEVEDSTPAMIEPFTNEKDVTWLSGRYCEEFGPADNFFEQYGAAFR